MSKETYSEEEVEAVLTLIKEISAVMVGQNLDIVFNALAAVTMLAINKSSSPSDCLRVFTNQVNRLVSLAGVADAMRDVNES